MWSFVSVLLAEGVCPGGVYGHGEGGTAFTGGAVRGDGAGVVVGDFSSRVVGSAATGQQHTDGPHEKGRFKTLQRKERRAVFV